MPRADNPVIFEEGYHAFFSNKKRDENPYGADSVNYEIWLEGFEKAIEDYNDISDECGDFE